MNRAACTHSESIFKYLWPSTIRDRPLKPWFFCFLGWQCLRFLTLLCRIRYKAVILVSRMSAADSSEGSPTFYLVVYRDRSRTFVAFHEILFTDLYAFFIGHSTPCSKSQEGPPPIKENPLPLTTSHTIENIFYFKVLVALKLIADIYNSLS